MIFRSKACSSRPMTTTATSGPKKTAATAATPSNIYSALVLTSNYIPENPIFFSRCLFVPITKQQKTDEQVEAFARFKDIEQDGLSFVTLEMLKHRALVEANLKQAYDDL